MMVVRAILIGVGVLALLMGGLWTLQGLGVIRWPAESFMIDQRPWITRGLLLALAGAALVFIGRRQRRR